MVWMELYLAVVKCCKEDCSAHCDAFVVERRKNGRMYDPYIARFLSPDRSALCDAFIAKWRKNYVQLPTSAQSFNRYSYCLNNPLKYVDPEGEFWHLIIGAAIGGIVNWASNGYKFNAKGLGYFATGAVAGALSAGIGEGVFTSGQLGGRAMLQHEFGHVLQYRLVGSVEYYNVIAKESFPNIRMK